MKRKERMQNGVKSVLVVLVYILLVFLSKLIQFWVLMPQLTTEEIKEGCWSWSGKKGEWLFFFPFDMGLPVMLLITVLLFFLFHGRDFDGKRIRRLHDVKREYHRKLFLQAAVLAGVLLGIECFGLGRLSTEFYNHIFQPEQIYYVMSGTMPFKEDLEFTNETSGILWQIAQIFYIQTDIWGSDLLNVFLTYLLYEGMRICFDKSVPLNE